MRAASASCSFAGTQTTTNDGDNDSFAFYTNGNWIIANEGEATLQVIDLNGRILSSETVIIDDDWESLKFPSFPELNEMLDSVDATFERGEELSDALTAALVFACGTALTQVYTSESSGTYFVDQAFEAYQQFGFSDASQLSCPSGRGEPSWNGRTQCCGRWSSSWNNFHEFYSCQTLRPLVSTAPSHASSQHLSSFPS